MRHAELISAATVVRLAVVPVAMLVASLFIPMPAQAGPYQLCVNLADSSGQPAGMGTQVFGCDPASVDRTLATATFAADPADLSAGYVGNARASSDAFDTVRLFASAGLTNYLPRSYLPYEVAPGVQGIDFAASARADYADLVTISGPAPLAVLEVSFGVTGTLTQNGASAQLCYGLAYGGPILGGTCVVGLPPVITVESAPFVPDGTPRALNFQFMAVVFNSDGSMTDPYTASAITDLEHTIILQELLVATPGGDPIPGITLTGGFDYPLSPLNAATAVSEPTSYALALAGPGLLGIAARRGRQRTPVRSRSG